MLNLLAFLFACPDLSGTYTCPASRGFPEFQLQLKTERLKKKRTRYTYQYSLSGVPTSVTTASKKGEDNTGFIASCKKKQMIYTIPAQPNFRQITELDADKNLQITVNGKVHTVCMRNP